MPRNLNTNKLTERDINILWDLYQYRVLSKEVIKDHYFSNSKSYENQRLGILKNNSYIKSGTFGGGTGERIGKKGHSYYWITQKGITLLRKKGYTAPLNANMLQIHKKAIPYIIEANKIILSIRPYGWTMKDSRTIKKELNLNDGDQIHGSLTSPEGIEYGFFVLETATTETNMRKTIKEISRLTNRENKTKTLRNFIIFAKGQDSINHFIERANAVKRDHHNNVVQDKLRPSGALCVLPLDYGITYLQSNLSDKSFFKNVFKRDDAPLHYHAPSDKNSFEFIAKYQGKEFYVINMLDADLSKIDAIEGYLMDINRMERFGGKVRDILVVTHEQLFERHQELIGKHARIEYHALSRKLLIKSTKRQEINHFHLS